MDFRKACADDLPLIEDIYAAARKFMAEAGNPSQWKNNYPSASLILQDISEGNLYIAYSSLGTEGVFAFIPGADPTYSHINGSWLSESEHSCVHRVASLGRSRGFLRAVMDHCFSKASSIRIDTHRDNIPMQRALEKYGFVRCGIIFLENGEERIAYQMVK